MTSPLFTLIAFNSPVRVVANTVSPTRIGELVNATRSLRQSSAVFGSTPSSPGFAVRSRATIRPMTLESRFSLPWMMISLSPWIRALELMPPMLKGYCQMTSPVMASTHEV